MIQLEIFKKKDEPFNLIKKCLNTKVFVVVDQS